MKTSTITVANGAPFLARPGECCVLQTSKGTKTLLVVAVTDNVLTVRELTWLDHIERYLYRVLRVVVDALVRLKERFRKME